MTNNLQNAIPNLSPAALAKLGSFLDDLIASDQSEVDDEVPAEETKTTKRRQRQKARTADQPPRATPKPKAPPKKRVILESEDIEDLEDEADDAESSRARPAKRKSKGDGKLCRTEPVRLSGINKFEEMQERNADKHLIEADKKAWKGRTPTPRSSDRAEKVSVRCRECRKVEDIPESLVYYDPDTHRVKHTCDSCLAGRR